MEQGQACVVIILGLRADFYGRAARERCLVPILQDRQLVVGPMTVDELRRAIREPARLVGFDVDEDLADVLIAEVSPRRSGAAPHAPGALPLLSHALLETWKRARHGRLTVDDYLATGGICGAVQQTAEQVFGDLTPEEQTLARRVFLRLVNVEDDALVTRKRVPRSELPSAAGGNDFMNSVIDCFVDHRLLTLDADSVEISHEALVTAWPRLRDWVDADRAGLLVHRQLGEAARLWSQADREPAELLRGTRLGVAQAWASSADHQSDLNDVESSFLAASREQARQEDVAGRRRTRRLQVLLAFASSLALLAGVFAFVALNARRAADSSRDLALSRQLAMASARLRERDSSLAGQLAVAAYRIAPTPEARSAMLDTSGLPLATRLLGHPGATALALSNDGRTLAVSRASDASVQLFSLRDDGPPTRGAVARSATPSSDLFAVAFSPDGRTIAAGGAGNVVNLWDIGDRAAPRVLGEPLRGFSGHVQSIAFSPDGRTLAAAGSAVGVLRWDVTDREQPTEISPLLGMTGTTQTVVFSPDGSVIAAAGTDSTLRLWSNDRAGLLQHEQRLPDTTINSVAFSRDGRMLAAGSKDKTIRVWDITQGGRLQEIGPPLTGFGGWVNVVTFSDDGRILAGGSSDNTIRFWNVDGWRVLRPVLTSPSPVTGLAFLPGKPLVISVAIDGTTRIWEWPGPLVSESLDSVFGLSFSSDGRRLAVFPNRGDDTIRIWDTTVRRRPRQIAAVKVPIEVGTLGATGAISPDGRSLAVGMRTGVIRRWDLGDLERPVVVEPALTGPTDLIEQIVFSPDGSLIAAGSDDGKVRLWQSNQAGDTGPLATIAGPEGLVLGIGFSPDGRLVAAASADKRVWLWDITQPTRPTLLAAMTGFENYVYAVAFSPDGRLLAAGSADKTVRLWDIANPSRPQPLGRPLTGPSNHVYSVAFHPQGQTLTAAVTDGTVWQWDVRNPRGGMPISTLTASASSQVFVVAYSPNGDTLVAADDDGVVHLWATDEQSAASEICSKAGDAITPEEWLQYFSDQRYQAPCR